MTLAAAGPPRNRLSIAHLMLWTLGSAIILAIFRALAARNDVMPPRIQYFLPFYHLAYSLTLGAQVGSVILFGWTRFRGVSGFPRQPGHWLLLVGGLSALFSLGGFGLFALIDQELTDGIHVYLALQIPALLVSTASYVLALLNTPKGSPWWYGLGLSVLLHSSQCVFLVIALVVGHFTGDVGPGLGLFEFSQTCLNPVFAAAVIVVNFLDRGSNPQRDFLHWTGVVALLANVALSLAFRFVVSSV